MAKIIVFGMGDIARLAHFYFTTDTEHQVVAFTVDAPYRKSDQFLDLPLVDFEEAPKLFSPVEHLMFIAVSYARMNQVRAEKYLLAKSMGYQLASYVSSRCTYLSKNVSGDNCFILEDNTIQPFVKIGNNITMWSGNHIGHDFVIDDHCFLASHIVVSGHVHIGSYCFLGVNATLRNGIEIAPKTLIGAGALIMKDTAEKDVYVPRRTEIYPKNSDDITL